MDGVPRQFHLVPRVTGAQQQDKTVQFKHMSQVRSAVQYECSAPGGTA
jgi:hypothetical protein